MLHVVLILGVGVLCSLQWPNWGWALFAARGMERVVIEIIAADLVLGVWFDFSLDARTAGPKSAHAAHGGLLLEVSTPL